MVYGGAWAGFVSTPEAQSIMAPEIRVLAATEVMARFSLAE